ncbi:MAG TPA: BamA/TamA family outer membrane protein [Draconibacterium sp.]|nr:BamA/TamA family outer membrane protein [Draconibacterium sp.]
MLKIRISVLPFFLLIFSYSIYSQENKPTRKVSVLPVPALGYSPETKTYVGAVTLFTFHNSDSLTRSSNASVEFNYTWNKQLIFESDWNYFLPEEHWFTRGLIHFSKYPDLYYGIGFNTPASNEVNFQSNRTIIDADLFRNIKNNYFVGSGIRYSAFNNIEYLKDSLIYNELKSENTFGLKVLFFNDARNNILSPTKGDYFEFGNSFNFSTSFYLKMTLDYRYYFAFGENDKHTLASRFYQSSVFGNPPFYDFAEIGGDEFVRGYFLGRSRDKNLLSLQIEMRNHLFWRIGIATFGGISMVYKNINQIENESFKPNAGFGFRFLVDKKENTNLRIDYAVGAQNQSGFYISFGESF